jgi:flagellar biogenesis protein FliO
MGYLSNFIVYTFAMVGVIVLALMVFKTSTSTGTKGGSKYLKVHDTLTIGPRKTLYIVSAGEEKFLIAGDVEKTTLISKLGEKNENKEVNDAILSFNNLSETLEIPRQKNYIDRAGLGIGYSKDKQYKSVMKNLAERIKN